MRVLVTRPVDASRRTAERLAAMGHQSVVLPLTQPEHHPDDVLEALHQPHSAIVLTSAEAVRVLRSLGDRLHPYLHQPVFAVGEATASAARDVGFASVEAAAGTAASMIDLLADRLRVLTIRHPLLYLAGTPRAPTLEEGLTANAVSFVTIEAYAMTWTQMDEESLAAALDAPVDAILLYSRATAERFFDLLQTSRRLDWLGSIRILCLSGNVAEAVPSSLQAAVAIAAQPDEDSLLSLLSS